MCIKYEENNMISKAIISGEIIAPLTRGNYKDLHSTEFTIKNRHGVWDVKGWGELAKRMFEELKEGMWVYTSGNMKQFKNKVYFTVSEYEILVGITEQQQTLNKISSGQTPSSNYDQESTPRQEGDFLEPNNPPW